MSSKAKYQLSHLAPEEQGVGSSDILAFVNSVEKSNLELHSFMLLRHGYVVAEGWWSPYRAELPHMLFSLSKSFTSTAVGFAVSEGLLTVDDFVISFFPDELPENISEHLAAMRVRHLLSMCTGHAEDTMGPVSQQKDGNWVKGFLDTPVDYAPGTHFVYNTGATYMLSAIIQKVAGQSLLEYLQPRLFEPLGIEEATWETCPRGINTGGFGLSVKTEDIAKLGQLYLQKGLWNGKRLLSEAWVDEATSSHISNGDNKDSDWSQGYGYQFWRCRHNAYRGDGAFGQYCIVMPEQDAVLAITSAVDDMQTVLNLVWEHLLLKVKNDVLQEDEEMSKALKLRLSSLALPIPENRPYSPSANEISGKIYNIDENEWDVKTITFVFNNDSTIVNLNYKEGPNQISCGIGKWAENSCIGQKPFNKILATGTWQNENTYIMTWRYIETPFYHTVTCHFDGDRLDAKASINISFGAKEQISLQGLRELLPL